VSVGEVRQLGPRFGPSERVAKVVESGRLTEGPMLRDLEGRLSEMSGATVRAVSSGAATLDIAMEVLRITRYAEAVVSVPTIGPWIDMAAVVRSGYHLSLGLGSGA
jgi:dTDP-4-amino-4,6-dideoxygalactose transaminase